MRPNATASIVIVVDSVNKSHVGRLLPNNNHNSVVVAECRRIISWPQHVRAAAVLAANGPTGHEVLGTAVPLAEFFNPQTVYYVGDDAAGKWEQFLAKVAPSDVTLAKGE